MKKQRFIEYDYEAVFDQEIDDIERMFLEGLLRGSFRGGVYATKEIRSGDQLEVEIYPQFTRKEKDQIPERGTKKRDREAMHNLNDRNSRKECERRINANFTDQDIWGTFTYREADKPRSWEEARKDMQAFIRRLNYRRKKMGLPNARYVYVTELSPKGRYHHHFVTDGDVPMDLVESLWTKGERNELRRLERDENGLSGMAHYMTKESKGKKRWMASKGLKRPEIKVTHYKIKPQEVREMTLDEDRLRAKCEKLFGPAGYVWTDGKTFANSVNGYTYLYGRMRLPKGERHEQSGADGTSDKRSGRQKDRKPGGSADGGAVLSGGRSPGKARGRKAKR